MWYVSIKSVVLGPKVSILHENLVERDSDPTSDLLNQNLCFMRAPGWFVTTSMSEMHCSCVFPVAQMIKNLPTMQKTRVWSLGWEENGYPLQYSCLENSIDRGAWRATVHGVTRVKHDWLTTHIYCIFQSSSENSVNVDNKVGFSIYFYFVFCESSLRLCRKWWPSSFKIWRVMSAIWMWIFPKIEWLIKNANKIQHNSH